MSVYRSYLINFSLILIIHLILRLFVPKFGKVTNELYILRKEILKGTMWSLIVDDLVQFSGTLVEGQVG